MNSQSEQQSSESKELNAVRSENVKRNSDIMISMSNNNSKNASEMHVETSNTKDSMENVITKRIESEIFDSKDTTMSLGKYVL